MNFLRKDKFFYMPSTVNTRDLVVFERISLTCFCSGELYQAYAFSALSKALMTKRFGGVPSRAVMLSVRAKKRPPKSFITEAAAALVYRGQWGLVMHDATLH